MKHRVGDRFKLYLPSGRTLGGQVMLSPKDIAQNLLPDGSPLHDRQKSLLVRISRQEQAKFGDDEVLIRGTWMIAPGEWFYAAKDEPFVEDGHEPLDVNDIYFPMMARGYRRIDWGELRSELGGDYPRLPEGHNGLPVLQLAEVCAEMLATCNDSPAMDPDNHWGLNDLRLLPGFTEVCAAAGWSATAPYLVQAIEAGRDLRRLLR